MKTALSYHIPRMLHQLGKPVRFGTNSFRMAGYFPCRFTTSSDEHEGFMEVVLRRILDVNAGTFVDVGVNSGQTLAKVLSIDKNRAYLGFEPQLSCCFNADQFIKANRLAHAQVLPVALGDNNRLLSFFSTGETDECASLIDQKALSYNRSRTFVQCRIGDEVLAEMGVTQISAIKIDVEGAEAQVMEGLKTTLANFKPTVIFEVLPNFSGIVERVWHDPETRAANRVNAEKIYKLLQMLGYRIFQIDETSGHESQVDTFDLDNIEHFRGSNFIAHTT